MEKNRNY